MQMTRSCKWLAGLVAVLSILATNTAAAQLMSTCAPDSPERRGQIGCTVFPSKPLPEGLTEPVFWHIDRFDSADRARAAVGPDGRRNWAQARRVQVAGPERKGCAGQRAAGAATPALPSAMSMISRVSK